MRCDDVTRELACPGDSRDDRALVEHLAHCRACADWADRAAKLDRLWETTRPADPGPAAWGSLWTSVNAALDAAPVREKAGRPWLARATERVGDQPAPKDGRYWPGLTMVATLALAQAAAILLAVGFAWHRPEGPVDVQGTDPARLVEGQGAAPALEPVIDVEGGQVPYIRSDGPTVTVRDVAAPELPNGEDPWYVFYGRIESAGTEVALGPL
jgi:hypothetical protein